MGYDDGFGEIGPKPILERYKVYIQSDVGIGSFGFKDGTLEEIYNPDNLTNDVNELSLSQRLEKHRVSGKSLVAKLAFKEGIITISPSSAYTISVTENKDNSKTPKKLNKCLKILFFD